MRVEHGKCGLQTDDSIEAAGKTARFLRSRVGRMVGGDHIHRAVPQPFDQRFAVIRRMNGRIHLEAAVVLYILFAKRQIVRSRFASDADTRLFGGADEFHAAAGGDMANMVTATRFSRQF